MAPPVGTLRVGPYFLALLAIFAVLYALVFWPGQPHTAKLGLDLRGGAQVVYEALTPDGKNPPRSSMDQARQILEDRVNGQGVAESEVVIQGGDQIVISIPGKRADDISDIGSAAKLNFRPVVMPPVQVVPTGVQPGSTTPSGSSPSSTPSPSAAPSHSASKAAQANRARPLVAPSTTAPTTAPRTTTPRTTAPRTTAPSPSAPTSASPAPTKRSADPLKSLTFPIPKSEAEYDKLAQAQKQQLQAALASFDCTARPPDQDGTDLLACDSRDPAKASLAFLLGPVIVPGTEISSARANAPNSNGSLQWTVSLNLKSSGEKKWAAYTGAHNTGGLEPNTPITSCGASTTACAKFVAFTLDGTVVTSPYNRQAINGGATQISGSFDDKSANKLANELKYGALPLTFRALTTSTVSPTLGDAQLKAGLLAGGIGLLLVVIYSLFYYRALGLVTIASLVVSGVLTYGCLVILGTQIGFTLTLAGIAGFIVAVGITADSFVVFFERMKDEVHEGRSMRVAVPRAWVRARRTILSADTVSFLAAAVLYFFAAGDVKGFAFTLGLSTVLDLVVVFLFTHPIVSLLSRSRVFGSARFTGLDSVRDGGVVADPASAATVRPAAKAPRVARPAKPPSTQAGAVAVLDRTDADAQVDAEGDPGSAPPVLAAPAIIAEVPVADPLDVPELEPAPDTTRVRTSPQPGSAAERAAARRARLRAEAKQKGTS
ncbi:MAG: protein translocase subunit SecD [Actinomycetota bacterium]